MNSISKGKVKVGKLIVEKLNIVTRDLGSGHVDQTLTNDELKSNIIFLTGTADAGFNVIFNTAFTNYYTVVNKSGQIATLKNTAGATVTVADGAVGIVQNDGTNIITLSGLSGTAVTTTGVQTLTNKTLTAPIVASAYQDAGKTKLMSLPDAASDTLVSLAATQTLTNKTLTTPKVKQYVASHNYAGAAVDWTLSASELLANTLSVTNANGVVNAILDATVTNIYLVDNQSGHNLTLKNVAGTTITVASTKRAIVYNDGTNIVRITADA